MLRTSPISVKISLTSPSVSDGDFIIFFIKGVLADFSQAQVTWNC